MGKYRLFEGNQVYGTPAFTIIENKIYHGDKTYGTPAYMIKGSYIYEGKGYGKPEFEIDGNNIYSCKSGRLRFRIDNGRLYRGNKIAYTIREGVGFVQGCVTPIFGALMIIGLASIIISNCGKKETEPPQKQTVKTENNANQQHNENVTAKDEFIFPDSDSRFLTEDEAVGLSKDELRIAINEIYARRGRKFETPELNEYFSSKSWYEPKYSQDEFSDDVFNEYEKANIELLVKYR